MRDACCIYAGGRVDHEFNAFCLRWISSCCWQGYFQVDLVKLLWNRNQTPKRALDYCSTCLCLGFKSSKSKYIHRQSERDAANHSKCNYAEFNSHGLPTHYDTSSLSS
jgi:hypothetical protein